MDNRAASLPSSTSLSSNSHPNMEHVREDYRKLLDEYSLQEQSIANIGDLYRKFKLLKLYEAEYEKNHEIKKELAFWEQFKSPNEMYLENEINKLNGILVEAQEKMMLFKVEQQKDLDKIEALKRELGDR